METEDFQERNVFSSYNSASHLNFIDLRLNTDKLMKDFEVFLTGKRIEYKENKDGQIYEIEKIFGEPIANKAGCAAIVNMLLMRAHHHCIQGNLNLEHYWNNTAKSRQEITVHIIENCYEWGIDDNKLNYIIDNLMDFLEKVISRLIDNKERESYSSQFQSRELIRNDKPRQGGIGRFMGGFSGT